MKIAVAARCYNEEKHIDRFLRGYSFADYLIISDGGSTDQSTEIIQEHQKTNPKIHFLHFDQQEVVQGEIWNPDAPHMNFVLDAAKNLDPDWLIFDDMDDVPNQSLRCIARPLLEMLDSRHVQVNAFRLYLWGDTGKFFPKMNDDFNPKYTSLWAWRPDKVNIYADITVRHGTLRGLHEIPYNIELPMCLLHKSWYPDTIAEKVLRYNRLGLPMHHPLQFAGNLAPLPEWAIE